MAIKRISKEEAIKRAKAVKTGEVKQNSEKAVNSVLDYKENGFAPNYDSYANNIGNRQKSITQDKNGLFIPDRVKIVGDWGQADIAEKKEQQRQAQKAAQKMFLPDVDIADMEANPHKYPQETLVKYGLAPENSGTAPGTFNSGWEKYTKNKDDFVEKRAVELMDNTFNLIALSPDERSVYNLYYDDINRRRNEKLTEKVQKNGAGVIENVHFVDENGNASNKDVKIITANAAYVPASSLPEPEPDGFWEWLGKQAKAGLNQFTDGLYSTLDLVLPSKYFQGSIYADLIQSSHNSADYYAQEAVESSASKGTGWSTGGELAQGVVAAIPTLVAAYFTGGGNMAAQSGTALTTASTASGSASTTAIAQNAAKSMAKNPTFWFSFAQTVGNDYENAKDQGADKTTAMISAILTSLLNAGIEMGGTEDLAQTLKEGGKRAIRNWVKSSIEEGGEEVLQGMISEGIAKLMYDQDKEWFSLTDETAVINPQRVAKEFGMGTAVGGILGGPVTAVKAISSKRSGENNTSFVLRSGQNINTADGERVIDVGDGQKVKYSLMNFSGEKTSAQSSDTLAKKIYNNRDKILNTEKAFDVNESSIERAETPSLGIFNLFKKWGGKAVNPELGTVELTKSGAKSTVGHQIRAKKYIAASAIKDVIEKGIVINHEMDWKGRGYDTYVIAAQGNVNGSQSVVAVIVKGYPNNPKLNNKFYLHEIIEVGEISDTVNENNVSAISRMRETSPTTNNISQDARNVKVRTPEASGGSFIPVDYDEWINSFGALGENVVSRMNPDGRDLGSFQKAVSTYYELGLSGLEFDKAYDAIKDSVYGNVLSELEARSALSAGMKDGARVRDGGVIADKTARAKVGEKTIKNLNSIAKKLRVTIEFVEELGSADGLYKNGKIYIALDAVGGGEANPYIVVASHEITHHMQTLSKKAYEKFRNMAVEYEAKEAGMSGAELVNAKRKAYEKSGRALSREEAMDEIAADFTRRVFSDDPQLADFLERMAAQNSENRNIIKKFFDSVKAVLKNIGEYIPNKDTVTINEVTKRFEETFNEAARNAKSGNEVKSSGKTLYQLKENLGQQLSDWMSGKGKKYGSYNGRYFDLGTTPDVFIKHGADKLPIVMTENCVIKITGGKHAISLDEVAKLPMELNDPVLLFSSSYIDKKGNLQPAFIALTEMVDKYGNDVVAIVHINKYQDRMTVNRIASLYSKSDSLTNQNNIKGYVEKLIKEGKLLDASTKKASIWFTSRGLQLPKLVQTIIDANNNISQNDPVVNTNSMQNGENNSSRGRASVKGASNVEISRRNPVDKNGSKKYNKRKTIKIPHNESVQLRDYIMHENHNGEKLKNISCKSVGNNFYIWRNNSKTDYEVINKLKIDGNEDLIRLIRKGVENGVYRKTEDISRMLDELNVRHGNDDRRRVINKNGRANIKNGELSQGEYASNGRGDIGEGDRDKRNDGRGRGRAFVRGASNQEIAERYRLESEEAQIREKLTYQALIKKPDMVVPAIESDVPVNPSGKIDRKKVITKAIENVREKNNSQNTEENSYIYIADIGKNILVNKDGLRHGLTRKAEATAKVTARIGDILENAIKINELDARGNSSGGYVLLGIGVDKNSNYYPVRVIVNNYSVDDIEVLDVLYAINAKKKNQSSNEAGSVENTTPLIKGSSTISIADLLNIVKEYFADILPEDVLNEFELSRPMSPLSESVKYSVKGASNQEIAERYRLENEETQIKEQLKAVNNQVIDAKGVERLAKDIIDYTSSVFEKGAVIKELTELIKLIKVGAEFTDIKNKAMEISRGLIENGVVREDGEYNNYKELSDRLLSADEGSLDDLYSELSLDYPEFFDGETEISKEQRLEKIAEVLENLEPVLDRSPGMELATENIANKILMDIAGGRAQSKSRKAKIAKAVQRERELREKKVAAVRDYYLNRIERSDERRQKSITIGKIRRRQRTLSSMLSKPNNKRHIPTILSEPVSRFLNDMGHISRLFVKGTEAETFKAEVVNRITDSIEKMQSAYINLIADYVKDGNLAGGILLDADLTAVMQNCIDGIKEDTENGNVREVRDLSRETLNDLNTCLRGIENMVRTANRLIDSKINAGLYETGMSIISENNPKKVSLKSNKVKDILSGYTANDLLSPESFFHKLGKTAEKVYYELRNSEGKRIRNIEKVIQLYEELSKISDIDEVHGKKAKVYTFKLQNGGELRFTKGQIMELYLLNKQTGPRGAAKNIYEGGISIGEIKQSKDGSLKYQGAVKVEKSDVQTIIETLSEAEKAFANRMGKDMEIFAVWGNEVSDKLYGYEKFLMKNYWPKKVDRFSKVKELGNPVFAQTIEGFSATKTREENIKPVEIGDAIDTFLSYGVNMATYNAYVIPVSNFKRVMGFASGGESVQKAITLKHGTRTVPYINEFLRLVNGEAKSYEAKVPFSGELLKNYKISKVGHSISTALKQCTSYVKAGVELNPKYLASPMNLKRVDLKQMYKYVPIAQWKAWGFYGNNMGPSIDALITGGTVLDKVNEKRMYFAGKADEITWRRIWNACIAETKGETDLEYGTEEFYEEAGNRFNEVIYKTQVVDSVFEKPMILNSGNGLTQMQTAYMNEPIASYNILYRAFYDFCQGGSKTKLIKAVGLVTAQMALTAAITTGIAWLKDDDEDKDYEKEFLMNWLGEALSLEPWVKSVYSILDGFTAERLDMELVSDLVGFTKKVIQGKYTWASASVIGLSYVGQMFAGTPVRPIKNNISMILGAVERIFPNKSYALAVKYWGNKYILDMKSSANASLYKDMLFEAYLKGDEELYKKIERDMMNENPEKFNANSIAKAMKSKHNKYVEDHPEFQPAFRTRWNMGVELRSLDEETEPGKADYIAELSFEENDEFTDMTIEKSDELTADVAKFVPGMDDETYNSVVKGIAEYAEDVALYEVTDEEYQPSAKWVLQCEELANNLGMSEGEFIYYKSKYSYQFISSKKTQQAVDAGMNLDKYAEIKYYYNDLEPIRNTAGKIVKNKPTQLREYLRSEGYSAGETEWIIDLVK